MNEWSIRWWHTYNVLKNVVTNVTEDTAYCTYGELTVATDVIYDVHIISTIEMPMLMLSH